MKASDRFVAKQGIVRARKRNVTWTKIERRGEKHKGPVKGYGPGCEVSVC